MPVLVILNTVPCFYTKIEDKKEAYDVGFMMKQVGIKQGDNFRFRVFDDNPSILEKERLNGYKLEEMNPSLLEDIRGEIRKSEFARFRQE